MTSAVADTAGPLRAPPEIERRLVGAPDLGQRQARADRLLVADGAGHLVHDLPVRADGRIVTLESRPWRVDPLPVVLDAATFRWLSLAVAERMEALEAVIADLYGPRTLVRDRIVPAEALAGTDRYRLQSIGTAPTRWLTTYAVDFALGTEGVWSIVQDLTDAPPGLGYALLDRSVMSRVWPDVMADADVASLARFPSAVRAALASVSGAESPRIVLFTGGLDHPSYVDHSYLGVQLGVNLAEGADLVVRQRRVWLRTLDGLEAVDVLYRRLEDPGIDPLEVGAQGSVGVPGLLQAVRAGGVRLANAHGSGVVEAEGVWRCLDAAFERVSPLEQSITPIRPGQQLATVPVTDGAVAPGVTEAAVVLRLFAVRDGSTINVLPGGSGRVLRPGDDPRNPTACVAKDVWVQGQTTAPVVGRRLPQVDFGRSVATRAADALYWTNRSAERAEAMARAMRVVGSRLEQDPGLAGLDGGAWVMNMRRLVAAVRRGDITDAFARPDADVDVDRLRDDLSLLGDAVAHEIGALLTEAITVREYLSVSTGRVLAHLAELRSALRDHTTEIDDLDAVLADFAAFAGLWQESTVRGPAWRIGDTGRRLERCLVILDLLDGLVTGVSEPASPDVAAAAIEVLLAANESLVAYRRRHRSDVELGAAIELLVRDESNPRSLAASIARLERHAADGERSIGESFVAEAHAALDLPLDDMVPAVRTLVVDAGRRVVSRWFSTPVAPIELTAGDR